MFLTTHNLYEAEELATRLAILKDGRIVTIKGVEELKRSAGECTLYIRLLKVGDNVVDTINEVLAPASLEVRGNELRVRVGDVNDNMLAALSTALGKLGITILELRVERPLIVLPVVLMLVLASLVIKREVSTVTIPIIVVQTFAMRYMVEVYP